VCGPTPLDAWQALV